MQDPAGPLPVHSNRRLQPLLVAGLAQRRSAYATLLSVQLVPLADVPIAGTIFASTHLLLRLWFRAIYHLTQTKQGISSIELGRRLG
jgi:hypothetical protein